MTGSIMHPGYQVIVRHRARTTGGAFAGGGGWTMQSLYQKISIKQWLGWGGGKGAWGQRNRSPRMLCGR